MLPYNGLILFLYKLGRIAFLLCRNGKRFQDCTSDVLSLSTTRYFHVFSSLGVECAPVKQACLTVGH